MSNRRKTGVRNTYRAGFLRSSAWFARRSRWFRRQERLHRPLLCEACGRLAASTELELHHLDYSGVRFVGGGWRAFERHDDLVPLHPYCHYLLHRLIDRDRVLAFDRSRPVASLIALERVRAKLLSREDAS